MEIFQKKANRAFREPTKTVQIERWYRKRLTQVAKLVGQIAKEYDEDTNPVVMSNVIQQRLFAYSATLESWAFAVSKIMLDRVSKADYDTWLEVGKKIGRETRKKLKDVAPTYQQLQNEQVRLIQSLPIEAAKKVHDWVQKGLDKGERYPDIAKRIMDELGADTESRAILIARTETARARSNFTQARAQAVGSTHYIWRTVGDGSVRPTHKALNGTIQRWDSPPVSDYGKGGIPIHSAPGCCFNCRCFASPIFPDDERLKNL